MLILRKVGYDLDKEWKFIKDMPIEENGMTNPLHGISLCEFKECIVPKMKKYSRGENTPDWMVPETSLFLWDEYDVIGLFRIRHHLNDELKDSVGHISFCIAKQYRRRGYGTEGFKLTLDFARNLVREDEFLLSVNTDNPASLKIILKNGGKIIREDDRKIFLGVDNPGKTRIHLETVTPDNWRLRFKLSDKQRRYVSEPTAILARAWAYREHNSQVYLVYADDINIGMVLCYDMEDMNAYAYSQFCIDCRYQQRGYGEEATRQIIDVLREDGRFDNIVLCYIEGNTAARCLYEKLGFVHNGQRDGDEIVMVKKLR